MLCKQMHILFSFSMFVLFFLESGILPLSNILFYFRKMWRFRIRCASFFFLFWRRFSFFLSFFLSSFLRSFTIDPFIMSLELIIICYAALQQPSRSTRTDQLLPEDKRRRDRRTPRISIQRYSKSSFLYLYDSGNEQALLNCCGCDHVVFRQLVDLFSPVFNSFTLDSKTGRIRKLVRGKYGKTIGRKREIDAVGLVGLVLYWFRTRGSVARASCMAFGLTSTPMYKWLWQVAVLSTRTSLYFTEAPSCSSYTTRCAINSEVNEAKIKFITCESTDSEAIYSATIEQSSFN